MGCLLKVGLLFLLASCLSSGSKNSSSSSSQAPSGVYCFAGLSTVEFTQTGASIIKDGYTLQFSGTPSNGEFTMSGSFSGLASEIDVSYTSDDLDGILNFRLLDGTNIVSSANGTISKGACPIVDLSSGTLKFVATNIINPSQISNISIFRSSEGHDFSDSFESCRSMKHYIEPFLKVNNTNTVTAPANLKVVGMNTEERNGFTDDGRTNQYLALSLVANPGYVVELFHVDIASGLDVKLGDIIPEGTIIGHGRLVRTNEGDTSPTTSHDFDIGVAANVSGGMKRLSYFDVITDSVMNSMDTWADSQISARNWVRDDFSYSAADRALDPITCNGEEFATFGTLPGWLSDRF